MIRGGGFVQFLTGAHVLPGQLGRALEVLLGPYQFGVGQLGFGAGKLLGLFAGPGP